MKDGKKTSANISKERWLSLQEIIDILQKKHGVKLTESSFRKYVQLELLPRSKRIGKKGKHKGSSGIYPASVIERFLLIRKLMNEDLTLEEIKNNTVFYLNKSETIAGEVAGLASHITAEMEKLGLSPNESFRLNKALIGLNKDADKLLANLQGLLKILAAVREKHEG